jgi:hypothetical protein
VETGALAMFDALGSRGIWKNHDPDAILGKLERIAGTARDLVEREFGGSGHPNTRDPWNIAKKICLGFVSDTIVVGFVTKEERHSAFAVMMAARYATEIALLGLEPPAPWSYRGVVAYGEFAMHETGNFFVGPAVDEAAEKHERANAALTWLTPDAGALVAAADDSHFQGAVHRREYDFPVKDVTGTVAHRAHVASPFPIGSGPAQAAQIARQLLATFDLAKPGVPAKHEATKAFLDQHLAEHTAIWMAQQKLIRQFVR